MLAILIGGDVWLLAEIGRALTEDETTTLMSIAEPR